MRLSVTAAIFSLLVASATAAEVVDGDTIRIGETVYRIEGIDAPEMAQRCERGNGKTWACGRQAARALVDIVEGKHVECADGVPDDYGRIVATCYAGDLNIGAAMVRAGMAWAFVKYSDSYVAEERLARSELIGIWQAENQPAWLFRTEQWDSAAQDAPADCPIKGNINRKGEHIYHAPWSRSYARTRIDTSRGERWFCSEAEALAAGWRAPLNR